MKNLKTYMNEAANVEKVIYLAGNLGKKQELRNYVNESLGIVQIEPISSKNPVDFVNQYRTRMNSRGKDMVKIFNLDGKGVGKGEVLVSYLSDVTIVKGSKSPYDLDFGKYHIEVKKFSIDKQGRWKGFGLHLKEIKGVIMNRLNELFHVAKLFIPELGTKYSKSVSTGYYYAGLISKLRTFDVSVISGKTDLVMDKSSNIFTNKFIKIGNINNQSTIDNLNNMAKLSKNVMNLEEIENILIEYVSKNTDKYYMFDDKAEIHFIDGWKSVSKIEFYTIDANGVKFNVTP